MDRRCSNFTLLDSPPYGLLPTPRLPVKSRYPPGIEAIINDRSRSKHQNAASTIPNGASRHPGYAITCPETILNWSWPPSDRVVSDEECHTPPLSPLMLPCGRELERPVRQVNMMKLETVIGNVIRIHDGFHQVLSVHCTKIAVILRLAGFNTLTSRLLQLEGKLQEISVACTRNEVGELLGNRDDEDRDVEQMLDVFGEALDRVVQTGFFILDRWARNTAQIQKDSTVTQTSDEKSDVISSITNPGAYQPPTASWWAGQEIHVSRQARIRHKYGVPLTGPKLSRKMELKLCGMWGRDASLEGWQKVRRKIRMVAMIGHMVTLSFLVADLIVKLETMSMQR